MDMADGAMRRWPHHIAMFAAPRANYIAMLAPARRHLPLYETDYMVATGLARHDV